MSTLSALFGAPTKAEPEDERLLDLYWNRNQLKKEFAELRNEKFRLAEQLKAQKGDVARLEQKLEHLEQLLIDPEWGRSILVMYQLRRLGRRCSSKIGIFAEQLKQQQEQKIHGQTLSRWRAGLKAELEAANAEYASLGERAGKKRAAIRQLETEFESLGALMRFFRKRSILRRIEQLRSDIATIEAAQLEVRDRAGSIEKREPPDVAGLTVAAKRSINCMILSYAQQLYLTFGDAELVTLVKESCDKSAGAVRYGSDEDCERILRRARQAGARLENPQESATELQQRAMLIGGTAAFEREDDTVPLSGTVAAVYRFDKSGAVETTDADLLGQNYWGLAMVLSR